MPLKIGWRPATSEPIGYSGPLLYYSVTFISNCAIRIEPRQPLLAGEIGERIDTGVAEIGPKALKLLPKAWPQHFLGDFAAFLVDDRTARLPAAKAGAGGRAGPGSGRIRASRCNGFVIRHGHHMVTRKTVASCVRPLDGWFRGSICEVRQLAARSSHAGAGSSIASCDRNDASVAGMKPTRP